MSKPARTVIKAIPRTLTQGERVLRGIESGKVRNEIIALEFEIRDFAKQKKIVIEEKKIILAKLTNIIITGQETRDIPCQVLRDFDKGVVQFIHDGEIVEERPMTVAERQATIDEVEEDGTVSGNDTPPSEFAPQEPTQETEKPDENI